ncbi:hypothetical protein NCS52_01583100 [Fusarium sp. LHS14.1]|nr:hypothetical protein NCS52_01588300 [Fusarium sp. LHS14.1]KAI8710310.1 hypothetical protein NCS52_01583100 [Fusarium sp. LHS14.1]
MEGLTSPDALTRCPKRVRLDSGCINGIPTWAAGLNGNSIALGFPVLGFPVVPLTPAASPDSSTPLAESTNPSAVLLHQGEYANHVKLSAPLQPLAPSPRRLDHLSQSKGFIDCVKAFKPCSTLVPLGKPLCSSSRSRHRPQQRPLKPKPAHGTAQLDTEPQRTTSSDVRPLNNPFTLPKDSPDILHAHDALYSRPDDGKIDGYIKLNWPSSNTSASERLQFRASKTNTAVSPNQPHRASGSTSSVTTERDRTLVSPTNITSQQTWTQLQTQPAQSTPSPDSGLQSQKDGFDKKLLGFYLKNWCPGRSVLKKTNPWLIILAQACRNTAISNAIASAIGCLAGIYIYDYNADERIREAVCRRYTMAAEYYKGLLEDPKSKGPGEGEEFVALGVVLSTIHVVQVQQRYGKPDSPSWLEGYKQCKHFLHKTNPGGQRSDLREAMSAIVGCGVISSQLLAPLPNANSLNLPEQEKEFDWLLFGNEQETLEVRGGCGLSTSLMHRIAHVSFCVSCLVQNPESIVFQQTPEHLLRGLETTQQWSREYKPWEMAEASQPIERIRSRSTIMIAESKVEVAEVTAEAWRITAMIYLLCRLLRLPRNHPRVVDQMDDLARCIRIIPTSGPYFTAQAPLLPVFILGLLAINPDYKEMSQTWFRQVIKTPVRSNVPLLLKSLERTWCWIDNDIKTPTLPEVLPDAICERDPWWEKLVATMTGREGGILCVV